MTERRKLELQLNQPVEIELLYDEPVVGRSQFGEYFLYAVKTDQSEYAFFAPEEVHQDLQSLRKGDKAIVTKLGAQRGNKLVTKYAVSKMMNGKSTLPAKPADQKEDTEPEKEKTDLLFEAMLSSYSDAMKIQQEFNGLVDVNRIAITLFIARSKINGNTINKLGE